MDIIAKTCSICKQQKDIANFQKRIASKDGLSVICKICASERKRAYYQANRERINKQNTAYHRTDKGKQARRRAYVNYRQKYYDKSVASNRHYWLTHKDQYRTQLNTWRRANPHKTQAQKQNRRARVNGGGGHFTPTQWRRLCRKYHNQCLCCGANTKLTVDHIVPVSKGGTSNIDNIQPLCLSCNSAKGARIIDYRALHDQVRQLSMW